MTAWHDSLLQDLRFTARTLRREWAFTLVAVSVLGLGLGASTTLFSAVNAVLLRPLSFDRPEQLVSIGSRLSGRRAITAVSPPEFMDMQRHLTTVTGMAAARGSALDLVGHGEPERVAISEVSPDFFRVLRVTPILGRTFAADEHANADVRLAVVSHALWQRRWGGDPRILGRTFTASRERRDEAGRPGTTGELVTFTVVGVMAQGFRNPPPLENRFSRLPPAEIWIPLTLNGSVQAGSRTNWNVNVVGRLASSATLDGLQRELDRLAASLLAAHPDVHKRQNGTLGLGATPLLDAVVGSRRLDLAILLGATSLLLLIACCNVASLLLARATDRDRELALRSALGAGRLRLVRQLLTESVVLGLLGGSVGAGLALLGTSAFRTLGPADFPRLSEVTVDLRVLGFGLVVSMVTGLLFGLAPAMLAARDASKASAGFGGQRVAGGRGTTRLKGVLVAAEIALALMLLTGSGLLAQSVYRLQRVDPGIDPDNVVLMQVSLPPTYASEDQRAAFFGTLRERLAALPGVRSVSHVEDPPMAFNTSSPPVRKEGASASEDNLPSAALHPVGGDYFRTMGIRMLAGRAFTGTDVPGSVPVAVVSEAMAAGLWPGTNPLGRRINLGHGPESPWLTVVGVVNGIRQYSLDQPPDWEVYVPYAQRAQANRAFMLVKTDSNSASLLRPMRRAVWALDANVPIPEFTTMNARVDATLRLPRFRAILLAGFALIALTLAAAGVYGTVLYVVGRRTREVGIRMALGANPRSVVSLMLRQSLWPVLAGIGMGVAGAFGATRVLGSVVFEIRVTDPSTFLGAAALLAVLGLLAAFVPARRATRVAPADALRAD